MMLNKSVVSILVILVAATGCAVSSSEDDAASEASVASNLTPESDILPVPEQLVPGFQPRPFQQPWDIQPYLDELRQPPPGFGQCVLRYVKIFDPGRGKQIELPIVVCP